MEGIDCLACKFSSAFFLKEGMTKSQEVLNIYVASWLKWILQFRWVSHIHKSLDAGEDLWLFKRKGEDCSLSETAYKIPTNTNGSAIPYSSCFTGISCSPSHSSYWLDIRLHLSASPLLSILLKPGALQVASHHIPVKSKTGPWQWLRSQKAQVVAINNTFVSASATLMRSSTQQKAPSSRENWKGQGTYYPAHKRTRICLLILFFFL